jgi:hypothetical protein
MNTFECVVCDKVIEKTYHWLSDEFPNLCHNHKDLVHKRRQQQFRDHLSRASKIVESWPEWKRNLLSNIVA